MRSEFGPVFAKTHLRNNDGNNSWCSVIIMLLLSVLFVSIFWHLQHSCSETKHRAVWHTAKPPLWRWNNHILFICLLLPPLFSFKPTVSLVRVSSDMQDFLTAALSQCFPTQCNGIEMSESLCLIKVSRQSPISATAARTPSPPRQPRAIPTIHAHWKPNHTAPTFPLSQTTSAWLLRRSSFWVACAEYFQLW